MKNLLNAPRNFFHGKKLMEKCTNQLPRSISLEPTNYCNLKCEKCPTYEGPRKRGRMDLDLYKKIMGDITSLPPEQSKSLRQIAFEGAGDPTLHKDLPTFVRLAKEAGIKDIKITTNSLGLTPELSKELLEAGLTGIKLSLDTNDAGIYKKYNKVDGYDRVAENIKTFCELKKDYDCKASMKVSLYKIDEPFIQNMKDLWSDHVDSVDFTNLHNWGGLRGESEKIRTKLCDNPFSQTMILWDGTYTLCCCDIMVPNHSFDNAKDLSLLDHWTKCEALNDIRKNHIKKDFTTLAMCNTCTMGGTGYWKEKTS